MMTKTTHFYLTIYRDRVCVKPLADLDNKNAREVTSLDDLRQFLVNKAREAKVALDDLSVMASSSLDFPEEFTSHKATIALAHAIKA